MDDRHTERWTISELAAQVALALSEAQLDQASGRVSDVPSERTIRYYTTHGLLDRPHDFEGRTAIYGERHLLQLLAIKRLQARGATLVEIQKRLLNIEQADLERLAGRGARGNDEASSSSEMREFWSTRPAELDEQGAKPPGDDEPTPQGVVVGVALDDDVTLLLQGAKRGVFEDDVEAVRAAAAPLMKLLKARHLI